MTENPQNKNLNPSIIAALIVGAAIIGATMIYVNGPKVKTVAPATINPAATSSDDASLKGLAECLTQKGYKFYGASWCGWCKKEKEAFKTAAQYLPYVECIDPKTDQLTEECQKVGIEGFPTWISPDGAKESGFKTPEDLAAVSGCPL